MWSVISKLRKSKVSLVKKFQTAHIISNKLVHISRRWVKTLTVKRRTGKHRLRAGVNTSKYKLRVNTNWVPGPWNTNLGPGPSNINWGRGPRPGPGGGKHKYTKTFKSSSFCNISNFYNGFVWNPSKVQRSLFERITRFL